MSQLKPSPTSARCKGVAFRELVRWYAAELGTETLRQRLGNLPAPLRQRLVENDPHLGLLASRWDDISLVHPLLDALTDGLSMEQRRDVARRGARAVMAVTLKGVYRTLFSTLATPAIYARLSSALWRSYYDTGEFSVRLETPTTAVCTIKNWAAHHPFICELNWGAASTIYEFMGLNGVSTERPECVGAGAPQCTFVTRWSR